MPREALAGFAAVTGADERSLAKLLDAALAAASPETGPRPTADNGWTIEADPAPPAESGTARPALAQLPHATHDFVGRAVELTAITAHLTQSRTGTAIVAVSGHGGTGKTALALQAAHRLAVSFPDGRLYADLRGVDTNPRDPADVLAQWLIDLGTAPTAVPRDLDARAAAYRTLLDGRRALIVLDNAADAAQIRPLIPGSTDCAVLVTSRRQLPALLDARHLTVGALADAEAHALLTATIGADRANAEPEAAARIVDRCAALPLALRIAGARLASRPAWTLATLAARVEDRRRRLDELAVGDTAVRAAFETSFAALADDDGTSARVGPALAFRLLGLFPGRDISPAAAAALFDVSEQQAEDLLESLADASLIQALPGGRYGLHDLLHDYAIELSLQARPEDRRPAATRLTGWYFHALVQAAGTSRSGASRVYDPTLVHPHPPVRFADRKAAIAWCDSEYENLRALVQWAAQESLGRVTYRLVRALYDHLMLRGTWQDTIEMLNLGLGEARRMGEVEDGAVLLYLQCTPLYRSGRADQAVALCKEAVELLRAGGKSRLLAHALNCLADAFLAIDRVTESLQCHQEAVDLYREHGPTWEFAMAVNNMAYTYIELGRFAEAVEPAAEAVATARQSNDPYGVASALDTLGEAYRGLGRLQEAIECLSEAVQGYEEADDRFLGGDAMDHYADALAAAGRLDEAHAEWDRAAQWLTGLDDKRVAAIRKKLEASGEHVAQAMPSEGMRQS